MARKRSRGAQLLKLLAVGLVIGAVVKELRLPEEERTWHGKLAGFIPYDFRMPSIAKFRAALWNPEGSIIVDRVFGVGWTINVGAVVARVRAAAGKA